MGTTLGTGKFWERQVVYWGPMEKSKHELMFRKLLDTKTDALSESFAGMNVSAPILFKRCQPNSQKTAYQQDYLELVQKVPICDLDDLLENFQQELNFVNRMSTDELKRFRKRIAKLFHPDRLDENASKLAKEFMTSANVQIDSEIDRR